MSCRAASIRRSQVGAASQPSSRTRRSGAFVIDAEEKFQTGPARANVAAAAIARRSSSSGQGVTALERSRGASFRRMEIGAKTISRGAGGVRRNSQ